jgi:hypothetical protein
MTCLLLKAHFLSGDTRGGAGQPPPPKSRANGTGLPPPPPLEREFFTDNLLVRIHFIIVMIRWTGLAPWEFRSPFPGSLASATPSAQKGCGARLSPDQVRGVTTGVPRSYDTATPPIADFWRVFLGKNSMKWSTAHAWGPF